MKQTVSFILILSASLIFSGCYAEPVDSDMVRIKEQFLVLRFHSEFREEMQGMSDSEIMQTACTQNRVRCGDVMEYFKKNDRAFYDRLQKK